MSGDKEYTQFDSEKDPLKNSSSNNEKTFTTRFKIFAVVCFMIIVTLVIVVAWQHFHYESNIGCVTEDCVRASAYVLAKMNTSVKPCENFYEYACGGWVKNHIIPPNLGKFGAFVQGNNHNENILRELLEAEGTSYKGKNSSAIRKVKTFYKTCMDEDRIEELGTTPVLKFIKHLGSWTVTSNNISGTWKESEWDIVDALVRIHLTKTHPLFSVTVTPRNTNNSVNIIRFMQSGLTLSDREEYLSDDSGKFEKALTDFATQYALLLGGDEKTVREKVAQIYKFEKSLAEIYIPRQDLTDPTKLNKKITVSELQAVLGDKSVFDVQKYLSKLLHDDFSENEEVEVFREGYFEKLGTLIKNTTKENLNNYFVWIFLQTTPGYLPSKFVDASLLLIKAETGVKSLTPRWQRCVFKAKSAMSFASGALFVRDQYKPGTREMVGNIIERIRSAFLFNLKQVDWMDDVTRRKAEEKARAVIDMIGYPDYTQDPVKLDKHYENLTVEAGEFFRNFVSSKTWSYQLILSKLREKPDPKEWAMSPADVNAYYRSTGNDIVVPYGILQLPFFDPSFPKFFNLASMGFILGHEFTHGFDSSGRNYDKYGNMKNWWTNESAEAFSEKTKCLENQYSKYTVNGIHLNGVNTLAENIADNSGLKAAYSAYKMSKTVQKEQPLPALHLTSDQLFFVAFAQVWCSVYRPAYVKKDILTNSHSVADYRVIGSVSNMAEFASAFSCLAGSPMNPVKKCQIW